jgi:tRNA(Ser,Leu) C12 N-acetylase TAN1
MAATVSEGLKALNAADLSALKARLDALRAAAEADLARKKQDAKDFMAELERAKRLKI